MRCAAFGGKGRTAWNWEVEITDDAGRLCALLRATIAVRDAASEQAASPGSRLKPAMLFVGTSGLDYPEWKGEFYPAGLRRAGFLEYYASRFSACEINTTFYGLQDEGDVRTLDCGDPRRTSGSR